MTSPTLDTTVGLAFLVNWIAGRDETLTVSVESADTAAPDGGSPEACAESATEPLSRSACVTV